MGQAPFGVLLGSGGLYPHYLVVERGAGVMLCGGLRVFSSVVRVGGTGSGTSEAIVSCGRLN